MTATYHQVLQEGRPFRYPKVHAAREMGCLLEEDRLGSGELADIDDDPLNAFRRRSMGSSAWDMPDLKVQGLISAYRFLC